MDSIQVPAPPRSAYNPNRRVSDLLLSQLNHFQHLEQKHGNFGIDPALAGDIHTEAGAARYIAAMTRVLRGQASVKTAKLAVMPATKTAKKRPTIVPNLAASATPRAKKAAKKAAKKPAAKKAAKSAAKRKK